MIADSILALHREDLISNPQEDVHITTELQEQGASLSLGEGPNEGEGGVSLPQDESST